MQKKDYEALNKNWLYNYAECISSNKRFRFTEIKKDTTSLIEQERNKEQAESLKKNLSLYIINFVYRYVLECETLEQALEIDYETVVDVFRLNCLFQHKYIFVGNGNYKISLNSVYDLAIILEILYNDYEYSEQIDCVLNNCNKLKTSTEGELYNIYRRRRKIIDDRIMKCEKLIELQEYYRKHRKEIHL